MGESYENKLHKKKLNFKYKLKLTRAIDDSKNYFDNLNNRIIL